MTPVWFLVILTSLVLIVGASVVIYYYRANSKRDARKVEFERQIIHLDARRRAALDTGNGFEASLAEKEAQALKLRYVNGDPL